MGISDPAIWFKQCTIHVHKVTKVSGSNLAQARNEVGLVFGRYADSCSDQRDDKRMPSNSTGAAVFTWFRYQLEEECAQPNSEDRILPTDKGNATVVLDRRMYDLKMKEIIDDQNTYRKLLRDPTTRIEKKISGVIRDVHRRGGIPDKLKDQLSPSYSNPPQIYGLPKIHKENTPLRPIVAAISSPTYRLAKN